MKPDFSVLGKVGTEVISGFTGIIDAMSLEHNGNWRYNLVPATNDPSKFVEGITADMEAIDITDEGIHARSKPPQDSGVEINDRVRDKVSGFEGVIVTLTWFFNGCCHARVVSEKLDRDGSITSQPFLVSRLVKLDEHPAKKEPKKPTGGPITRNENLRG